MNKIIEESSNSGELWIYIKNEGEMVQLKKNITILKPTLLELKEDFESIEYKKVTVTVKCPDNLILETDEIFLHRILKELMRNSARYSDDEVHIDLFAEELNNPHVIVITVRDNGWGIPKKDMRHVFTIGYQIIEHVMKIGDDDGMGLGLPFVESFTTALGGAVDLTSVPEHFTQVQLFFPITPEDEKILDLYRKYYGEPKDE